MILFDRSRYQTGLSCLRRRWYEYEYPASDGKRGIRAKGLALPLLIGGCVHAGLATLLRGAQQGRNEIEHAVADAVWQGSEGFWPQMEKAGLQLEVGEDAPRVAREAAALIEALLRAYAHTRLPLLMAGDSRQEWEVVEVEQEDNFTFPGSEPPLVLMARADALLKEVCSGDLYVQSFKTAAGWDSRQEKANRYDTQGLSEVMAVQARLPEGQRVMGVRMEYLLKGRRAQYPEGSGQWVTFSPLLRGYKTRDSIPGDARFAWSYDWTDPEDINPKTGKAIKHTLSYKAWEPFWVWEEPTLGAEGERVARWVEMLASGEIQPEAGNALDSIFVTPVPYFRQDEHIERLKRQMEARETAIAAAADALRGNFALYPGSVGSRDIDLDAALDSRFPMNSQACAYPGLCQFASICWEGADLEAGLREGEWVAREPHHRQEGAQMAQAPNQKGLD